MGSFFSSFQFSYPGYLLGLMVIPFLAYAAYRGLLDFPVWQRRLSAAVRIVLILLVVLALAGLTRLGEADRPYVVFVIDRSQSVGANGRRAADEFVVEAMRSRGNAGVGFMDFGAVPGPFRSDLAAPAGEIDGRSTDLAAALQAARLGVPPGYTPHLVLLSDGNETEGDARAVAARLGVRVSTWPLPPPSEPDIQVSAVVLPPRVRPGETFSINVTVDANQTDHGRLRLRGGISDVNRNDVEVHPGSNHFTFTQTVPANFTGRRLICQVIADNFSHDSVHENNISIGLTEATGKPAILLVEPSENGPVYQALALTLEGAGMRVIPTPPSRLADKASELQLYDLVILGNVPVVSESPEHQLSNKQMDALAVYVRELGGGLLVIGGDQAFGPGGYFKTPLEDILPVTCDYEKKDKKRLDLVLIIDKSGSMNEENKLNMARNAAVRAIETLGPHDKIGVITFDEEPHKVVDLSAGVDKAQAVAEVRKIMADGETLMYPPLKMAFADLSQSNATHKHVILLTDGEAHDVNVDFAGLVRQMANAHITVSTVGVGGDLTSKDLKQLEMLAQVGKGRYYYAGKADTVPQIFARETELAGKSAVQEGEFRPTVRPPRIQPLRGIQADAIPSLGKYVLTRPRPLAEVGLAIGEQTAPLLAMWQPGLGMSAVFTSGLEGKWRSGWDEGWPQYPQFWGQLARYLLRKDFPGLAVKVDHRGTRGVVTIDVSDANGWFIEDARLDVRVLDSDSRETAPTTTQIGPGRYLAEFDAPPGRDPSHSVYGVIVVQKDAEGKPVQWTTTGLAIGYPEEIRLRPPNEGLLRAVAEETGGTFRPAPQDVFAPPPRLDRNAIPLWPYLVAAAAFLFVLDVALRRIDLSVAWPRWNSRKAPAQEARTMTMTSDAASESQSR